MIHSTNFNDKDIQDIKNLYEFISNNEFSSFYRNKLENAGITDVKDYEDFIKIPILTKKEVVEASIKELIFVDEKKIKTFSMSSGTTGGSRPSLMPHMLFSENESPNLPHIFNILKKDGLKKFMFLQEINSRDGLVKKAEQKDDIALCFGQTRNLPLSAKIFSELEIDAIISTPTIFLDFVKELEKTDYDFKKMLLISLGAEFSSGSIILYLQEKFPNAYFDFRYGASEFKGHIGYRCEYLGQNFPPNIFHINPRCLIEIVDDDSNTLPFGEYGNILITDLNKRAFPLLRYKIGDIGKLTSQKCACGESFILEMGGRSGNDFLKIHGLILRTDMIYNSLIGTEGFFESRFEVHVYEEKILDGIYPKLILKAKMKDEQSELKNDKGFISVVLKNISSKLFLGTDITLEKLVEKGKFLPLEIELVDKWDNNKKHLSIVPHFD